SFWRQFRSLPRGWEFPSNNWSQKAEGLTNGRSRIRRTKSGTNSQAPAGGEKGRPDSKAQTGRQEGCAHEEAPSGGAQSSRDTENEDAPAVSFHFAGFRF